MTTRTYPKGATHAVPEVRFWRQVDVRGPDECWVWKGRDIGPRGHARFLVDSATKTRVMAHRYAYELQVGPIPDGLLVCHHCDNPPCVNGAHLFLGTQADNINDSVAKHRHPHAAKTHCPQGHPYSGENLVIKIEANKRGRRCRTCHADQERARHARLAQRGFLLSAKDVTR